MERTFRKVVSCKLQWVSGDRSSRVPADAIGNAKEKCILASQNQKLLVPLNRPDENILTWS